MHIAVGAGLHHRIDFDFPNQTAKDMLDELASWTNALRAARAGWRWLQTA